MMTFDNSRSISLFSVGFGLVAALVAVVFLPAAPAKAAAVDVGQTNLVKNSVFGTRQGQPRMLMLRDRVYFDEEIVTGTESATQITFADDTKLTMGPNARMILDEMIYDPRDPTISKMSMTMVQGVFSFVSGKMKSTAYTVNTPTTTIGVRGTAFSVLVRPNGTSAVTLSKGIVQVAAGGQVVGLMEPGKATVVRAAPRGAPPPPPSPPAPPPADMAAEMAEMNTLVASAAAEAGTEADVLDVPTEVSAPLGPEDTSPPPEDGGEVAEGPAQVPGRDAGEQTDTAEPTDAADGAETGALPEIDSTPEAPQIALDAGETVAAAYVPPPETVEVYEISIAEDTQALFHVYVNTNTGDAYGHFEGEVNGVHAVGVMTGTYSDGIVTGNMHIQPNDRDGNSNAAWYYTADSFTMDLNAGSGDLALIKYDNALTGSTYASSAWTSALVDTLSVPVGDDFDAGSTMTLYASGIAQDSSGNAHTDVYSNATFDPDADTGPSTHLTNTYTTRGVAPGIGGGLGDDATYGKRFFGVSPESVASGYKHLAWGHWGDVPEGFESAATGEIAAVSYWVGGVRTPDATVLGQLGTTTATYAGEMAGGFFNATDDHTVLRGTFSVNANLTAKTFTGSYDLSDRLTAANFISSGGLSGSWDTGGNITGTMSGTAIDTSTVTGSVDGAFFGPKGEEVGGAWYATLSGGSNPGSAAGVYAGTRQ